MATYDALAVVPPTPAGFGANGLPALTDSRGRRYTYARISLTDRCDMACVYCMPPGGEDEHAVREELMTFEEVARLVQVLAAMGVTRVRFTGRAKRRRTSTAWAASSRRWSRRPDTGGA